MSYKTVNGLMRHLRDNNIAICGKAQKRQLINTGYFHGYKGYRFFKNADNRLPFVSYNEIYATIQYDTKLKTLFYDKVMFIETAIKNISIESILKYANSENIDIICDRIICSYKNAPQGATEKTKEMCQRKKLALVKDIQSILSKEYANCNPKITHFYNSTSRGCVPIWALFEAMTLGSFGNFLSCLTHDVRDDISRSIGFNLSCDTNRELVYKYLYALKDLRNAIAHNDAVFDTRFRRSKPSKPMTLCLKTEMGLPYVNFDTIGDYVALVCYYLKLLKVPRRDIKSFIGDYEKIMLEYSSKVNSSVKAKIIHADTYQRIHILKSVV